VKARHAHSLQQSAPPEPLAPSEDVATVDESDDVPTIFDGAVFQDEDDRLLWRLVWGIVWCASVLLVACFAAFPIALIIRGSPEPAMNASVPEEVTAQPGATVAVPAAPGLGVQEGAFDELFGELENEATQGAVAFGDFPSRNTAPASEALRPQKSEFTPSAITASKAAAVPQHTAAGLGSEQGKALAGPASAPVHADGPEADVLDSATFAEQAAAPGLAAELDSAGAQPSMSTMPAAAGVSAGARVADAALARPPEVQTMEVEPAWSAVGQAVAPPAGADLERGADLPLASAMAGQIARAGLAAREAVARQVALLAGFGESVEVTPETGSAPVRPSDRVLTRASAAAESAAVGQVPNPVAAPEIVASPANAMDRPPAAVSAAREVPGASAATPDAEPAADLETARTAAEPSSVAPGATSEVRLAELTRDAGRPAAETAKTAAEPSAAEAGTMFEVRAAAAATPDAGPTTVLEMAEAAAEPSAAAVREVSEAPAGGVAIPDADSPTAVRFATTATEPSAAVAGAMFETTAAEVAAPGAEPTIAPESAGTVAEPSASRVRGVSEGPIATVTAPDADSTTDLEAAATIAEPSAASVAEPAELSPGTGRAYSALAPEVIGESQPPALDSEEIGSVPAPPTPRLPRPRPADVVIVFAPPDLPEPVERRSEPELPRRERPAASQDRADGQASSPVQVPRELESGVLALPPALLPIRPPRSSTSLESAPN
jgi:hypothetical protein